VGRLRIVAGALKGRKIEVPARASLRPTADRVREALFNILQAHVAGARVLDAYCGTGALGFEALSRGAAQATFIDADREILDSVRSTAQDFGVADRCVFMLGAAGLLLRRRAVCGPFDLIVADPPYASGDGAEFLGLVPSVLAPGGTVVIERDRREPPPLPGPTVLGHVRTAQYGRTCLDFFRSEPGG
jgi:16S rRNA (guanine966-N2)-methyltransferase